MKIIFLGTGPVKSIPRLGCKCPVCQDARKLHSKSKRTRSSIILTYSNLKVLIDASPDFLLQVKQNKIKKIDAVLITHPHKDAYGGIKKLDKWLKKPIPLYCQKQTWHMIKNNFINLIFNEIKANKKFEINNLSILPLQVYHSIINEKKFPTLAYKINNLIYCSDVKKIPARSLKYFKNINTLILDAAMYFDRQIFTHLNAEDAILIAQKLNIKKLYLTQIGHSYPQFNKAQKAIISFVKNKNIKVKTNIAFDGQKINL
ncbi:MBL fold metallo-hydrolase [Candidatus Falkowbacteria bacterium]|nr:MBL fold metallo-hydrolase [Candidatus Falkowbacteria bacterium]